MSPVVCFQRELYYGGEDLLRGCNESGINLRSPVFLSMFLLLMDLRDHPQNWYLGQFGLLAD